LNYAFKADTTSKSFIFSLNINTKLSLVQPSFAISNKNDYGPVFGKVYGPSDIFISAKANTNFNGPLDSKCNVGNMYKNSVFTTNAVSNQAKFCGTATFAVK
jgi:hypothetical protein